MRNIFIVVLLAAALQGCFAVGVAAGAAGIAVVNDHRRFEQMQQDQETANIIYSKYKRDPLLTSENSHLDVTSFNDVVLITGQTLSQNARARAEELAKSTPYVKRVYNDIAVKGPTSSLTRASDSWITTKIKTQMVATKGLKSSSIKVVTENGSVYLMGIVSHEQAEIAVDIAREVSGVQKVVKIFQYK